MINFNLHSRPEPGTKTPDTGTKSPDPKAPKAKKTRQEPGTRKLSFAESGPKTLDIQVPVTKEPTSGFTKVCTLLLGIVVYCLLALCPAISFGAITNAQFRAFPQGEVLMSKDGVTNLVALAEAKAAASNAATRAFVDGYTNSIATSASFVETATPKTPGWDLAASFVLNPSFAQQTNSWSQAAVTADYVNTRKDFWDFGFSFAFDAASLSNGWEQAHQWVLENGSKAATWDLAIARSVSNASDIATLQGQSTYWDESYWRSLTNEADIAYLQGRSGSWDTAYELSLTNAALKADKTYVDTQDALDRAYALSLLTALTSTNSSSLHLLDRYNPLNSWLEYGSNALTQVLLDGGATNRTPFLSFTNLWTVTPHTDLATTNQLNNYLPLAGGTLNLGAGITMRSALFPAGEYTTAYGVSGITYGGGLAPSVSLSFPDWADGSTQQIASRQWVNSQSYVPYTGAGNDVDLGLYGITAGTFIGDGSSITNVDASTLAGYDIDAIMAVGSTYFFSTNFISYGAVTGREASLAVPSIGGSLTYPGPVTNGQYLNAYLIPADQMPALISKGTKATFEFYGGHAGTPSQHPTLMGDFYIMNTNGTVVQEFESPVVVIPRGEDYFKLEITFTNDVIKDGYAFLLKTRIIDRDGYTGDFISYFGKPYYTGFSFPKATGVFTPQYVHDTHAALLLSAGAHGGIPAGLITNNQPVVSLGSLTVTNLAVNGVANINDFLNPTASATILQLNKTLTANGASDSIAFRYLWNPTGLYYTPVMITATDVAGYGGAVDFCTKLANGDSAGTPPVRMRINHTGNVLVGTTTDDATSKMQINGITLLNDEAGVSTDSTQLVLGKKLDAAGKGGGIDFRHLWTPTGLSYTLSKVRSSDVLGYGGTLEFYTKRADGVNSSSPTLAMKIHETGNIVASTNFTAYDIFIDTNSLAVNPWVTPHNSFTNRDALDAHPIPSITGLSENLASTAAALTNVNEALAIVVTNYQPSVSFTNVTITGEIVFANGVRMRGDKQLNGTNGVYLLNPGGTTENWILLPPDL